LGIVWSATLTFDAEGNAVSQSYTVTNPVACLHQARRCEGGERGGGVEVARGIDDDVCRLRGVDAHGSGDQCSGTATSVPSVATLFHCGARRLRGASGKSTRIT
jgi:hypothetical protein